MRPCLSSLSCFFVWPQEHFQKQRIETSMGLLEATPKAGLHFKNYLTQFEWVIHCSPSVLQIAYLHKLGCTIAPSSRLHASRLIEQYKSLWTRMTIDHAREKLTNCIFIMFKRGKSAFILVVKDIQGELTIDTALFHCYHSEAEHCNGWITSVDAKQPCAPSSSPKKKLLDAPPVSI